MIIRDYASDDLSAIHGLNDEAVPAVGEETVDALAEIATMSSIALVVEADDDVAGFALVLPTGAAYGSPNYRWFSERYDRFVYLDRVAISPRHRRRGIGRALYAEVERLAAERHPDAGHFALEVNLEPRNDVSLAFHAELGFAEVGQQRTPNGKLVSMMLKPLDR